MSCLSSATRQRAPFGGSAKPLTQTLTGRTGGSAAPRRLLGLWEKKSTTTTMRRARIESRRARGEQETRRAVPEVTGSLDRPRASQYASQYQPTNQHRQVGLCQQRKTKALYYLPIDHLPHHTSPYGVRRQLTVTGHNEPLMLIVRLLVSCSPFILKARSDLPACLASRNKPNP